MKKPTINDVINIAELIPYQVCDDSYKNVSITSDYVHRLGLELIGTESTLGPGSILVAGSREKYFLKTLSFSEKEGIYDEIFSKGFACLIVTNSLVPEEQLLKFAKKYKICVLSSKEKTTPFISNLTNYLEECLEPTISRPAGLISIHGEGVLLTGESGIGKSEVALELIHRGHKFVSDDVTEIRKLSSQSLIGFAPGNISRFIEVRGIGMVNVQQLFGVNATKESENINLVVNFEIWRNESKYDRTGIEQYVEILGIKIPYVSIPVKPGKNLAILVEVAAMNVRLKKFGMNPYGELMAKLVGGNPNDFQPKPAIKANLLWDK